MDYNEKQKRFAIWTKFFFENEVLSKKNDKFGKQ